MKISEVMGSIGPQKIPIINWNSHINEVIRVMAEFRHTRLIYVVDEEKRLKGMISVGSLLRHIYPHHYEGKIHSHGILKRLTAETANHIMEKCSITTIPNESVDEVLRRMARSGAKEVPVLNKEGFIIGDITAIDLICYSHKASGK